MTEISTGTLALWAFLPFQFQFPCPSLLSHLTRADDGELALVDLSAPTAALNERTRFSLLSCLLEGDCLFSRCCLTIVLVWRGVDFWHAWIPVVSPSCRCTASLETACCHAFRVRVSCLILSWILVAFWLFCFLLFQVGL